MNDTNDYIRRGDAIDAVYERILQIGYEKDAKALSIRQAVRDVPAAISALCEFGGRTLENKKYVLLDDVISHLAGCEKAEFLPATCDAIRLIENLPAADVRPVIRGTKVDSTNVEDWAPWCRCSVCGYDSLFAEDNFCSNCGADLRGDDKEEHDEA